MRKISKKTLELVQLSILGAIIVILAFTPFIGYIQLGVTRATIIHIPVIIGSILLGPKKGAVLGFLFGLTSLIMNTAYPTLTSFTFTPFYSSDATSGSLWSLVVCFVPRILVGIVPYFVYKGLKHLFRKFKSTKTSNVISLSIAGLAGSLTNTLLVMNMIFLFFKDNYSAAKNIATDTLYNVILGVIAVNGLPEAILAAVLTSVIVTTLVKTKTFKIKEKINE